MTPEEYNIKLKLLLDTVSRELIKSWSDLYKHLKILYSIYATERDQQSADIALMCSNAFVSALEALPEESDALEIAYKMNEYVVAGVGCFKDEQIVFIGPTSMLDAIDNKELAALFAELSTDNRKTAKAELMTATTQDDLSKNTFH